MNKYYLQIKVELENKLNLLILLYKKLFKNKEKHLKGHRKQLKSKQLFDENIEVLLSGKK